MIEQPVLSVISPVLNEEFFLPLYLEAVLEYADEVLLLDGGSKDNSLQIMQKYQQQTGKVRYWSLPQTGQPYSSDWKEGHRRNYLINKARGRWILVLDVDEFLSDNFKEVFREKVIPEEKILIYGFNFIPFWNDVQTVRCNTAEDPHWEGDIFRLIKADRASYNLQGNHSLLLCNQQPPWKCYRRKRLNQVTLFHYHYALGQKIKKHDNRRGDVNMIDEKKKPDWNYRPTEYKIRTRIFKGSHPAVIESFLESQR